MFNVNGVGCTFCNNPDPNECPNDPECLAAPTCDCTTDPNQAECCANTPCCFGCSGFGSLECNVSSCICEPEECCQTICPTAPAPVLGPVSPAFGAVAAALVAAGSFVLVRQRARRQRQLPA
jgi:hypothetical protein